MTWDPPSDGSIPDGWQATNVERQSLGEWFRRYWWVALIAVGLAAVAINSAVSGESEPSADEQRYVAHAACADFTRDRLKAPGSADFPEYDDRGVTITSSGSLHRVSSFVDAENGFGANIRTFFTCEVRDTGDGWRLVDWSEL